MSKEKAVDYFDRHPSSNECHITSDERVFHSAGTAQGFAESLKDNKVTSYKRADFEAVNVSVVDAEELTGFEDEDEDEDLFLGDIDTSDAPVIEVPKIEVPNIEVPKIEVLAVDTNIEALKAFDSETASYEEGKALVKALSIETPSNTKVDIFAALELAKTNLQNQA